VRATSTCTRVGAGAALPATTPIAPTADSASVMLTAPAVTFESSTSTSAVPSGDVVDAATPMPPTVAATMLEPVVALISVPEVVVTPCAVMFTSPRPLVVCAATPIDPTTA
jgi:hypothetical protein